MESKTTNQNTEKGVMMTHEIYVNITEPTCNRRFDSNGDSNIAIHLTRENTEARAFVKEAGARWTGTAWILGWSGLGEGIARIVNDLSQFGNIEVGRQAQFILDDLA